MGKITIDLGSIMDWIQGSHSPTPQQNPNFATDQGDGYFTNTNGDIVPTNNVSTNPYTDPGIWGNPTARALAAKGNFDYNNYGLQANMENNVNNNIGAGNLAKVAPLITDPNTLKQLSNPDTLMALSKLLGGNTTAGNIAGQEQFLSNINSGQPQQLSSLSGIQNNVDLQRLSTLQQQGYGTEDALRMLAENDEAKRTANANLDNNIPERGAYSKVEDMNTSDLFNESQQQLISNRTIAEQGELRGKIDSQSFVNTANLNNAKTEAGLSDTRLNNLGSLQKTLSGNIMQQLVGSTEYNGGESPVRVSLGTDSDGNIVANKSINPAFATYKEKMEGMGFGSQTQPLQVKGGPTILGLHNSNILVPSGSSHSTIATVPIGETGQSMPLSSSAQKASPTSMSDEDFRKFRDNNDKANPGAIQDSLLEEVGKYLGVQKANIGSSILTHSLAGTVKNLMSSDKDFAAKVNNLPPEVLQNLYARVANKYK